MNNPFKPDGYSSVSPYIVADGADRVIDFLNKTFDARPLRRFDGPDGTIVHAEVQIEDSVIMISDGSDTHPPFPAFVHVYVADVDATYHRALDAGGTSVDKPQQQEGDPDRRGGVRDSAGNIWWISTMVE